MISIKDILPEKEDRDLARQFIVETSGSLYKVTDTKTGIVIYHA